MNSAHEYETVASPAESIRFAKCVLSKDEFAEWLAGFCGSAESNSQRSKYSQMYDAASVDKAT